MNKMDSLSHALDVKEKSATPFLSNSRQFEKI